MAKIPCYVVVFFDVPTVKKSLNFLCDFYDRLEIHVIENPSKYSPEIKEYIHAQMNAGKIVDHFLFEKNITGNALTTVAESIETDSDFILFTDGDLVADNTWLDESLDILKKHDSLAAVSVELSLHNLPTQAFPEAINWVPSPVRITEDYIEGSGGHHLLLFRTKWLKPFLEFLKVNKLNWTDGSIRLFLARYHREGSWVKTKNSRATHLTWDLYADRNHEYTRFRESKSLQETWDHNEWCGYERFTKL